MTLVTIWFAVRDEVLPVFCVPFAAFLATDFALNAFRTCFVEVTVSTRLWYAVFAVVVLAASAVPASTDALIRTAVVVATTFFVKFLIFVLHFPAGPAGYFEVPGTRRSYSDL